MISGASTTVGFAAAHKEFFFKAVKEWPKMQKARWGCIPLAVEMYGGWGEKACETLSVPARG